MTDLECKIYPFDNLEFQCFLTYYQLVTNFSGTIFWFKWNLLSQSLNLTTTSPALSGTTDITGPPKSIYLLSKKDLIALGVIILWRRPLRSIVRFHCRSTLSLFESFICLCFRFATWNRHSIFTILMNKNDESRKHLTCFNWTVYNTYATNHFMLA